MKLDEQTWLRPLRFVARSIKYIWLFWLWWIGLGSLKPDGEDVRNVWNPRDLWFYLVLTIISVSFGVALHAIVRI